MSEPSIRVAEIHRFPVKSMAGERIESASLDRLGIAGDRRYAVRDLDTGKVLSAKRPSVGRTLLNCGARTVGDAVMVRVGDHEFPVADTSAINTAINTALNDALSTALGVHAVLDGAPGTDEVYESYWPEMDGLALSDVTVDLPIAMSTEKGTFVDLAALHILTTASLAHLRNLAPESMIDVTRFRPSIVLDTGDVAPGFVENGWVGRRAQLGTAVIEFGTAAPRCVMTTLSQGDLPEDRDVMRTIADHNRQELAGFGEFACLGIYAEVVEPGDARVGDECTLLPE